jgi:hypothetical protein
MEALTVRSQDQECGCVMEIVVVTQLLECAQFMKFLRATDIDEASLKVASKHSRMES